MSYRQINSVSFLICRLAWIRFSCYIHVVLKIPLSITQIKNDEENRMSLIMLFRPVDGNIPTYPPLTVPRCTGFKKTCFVAL